MIFTLVSKAINTVDMNFELKKILYKLVVYPARLLFLPFTLLLIGFLYLIKPIKWVRVGQITGGRLGHLTLDTDILLRRIQAEPLSKNVCYFFVCGMTVANKQVLTMLRREMNIFQGSIPSLLYGVIFPVLERTPFHLTFPLNSSVAEYARYDEYNKAKPPLSFLGAEMDQGRELLMKMGLEFGEDRYVCVFARDSAYLGKIWSGHDYSYHDMRDGDINSYAEAIEYLLSKGYFILRMGAVVETPLKIDHPRVIDYAMSEFRSEFMDVFLMAHCKFFLGDTAGIFGLAYLFDVPTLSVNHTPFGLAPYCKTCLFIPKKLKKIDSGDSFPFYEAAKSGLEECQIADILKNEHELKYVDNTPAEILAVTREMCERLEGSFKYSEDEKRLMDAYCGFVTKYLSRDLKAPVGIMWLKENKELYFEDLSVIEN